MLNLKNSGLTFLELIIVLSIIGILAIFSTPLMLASYKKNQREVLKNGLISAVKFSRTLATLQDRVLILTPFKGAGNWSTGAILFVDNKKHQYQEGTKILHQWRWKQQGLRIDWQGLHSRHYIIFAADPGHAASSGHFMIQNVDGDSLKLTINRLGRIKEDSCKSKI